MLLILLAACQPALDTVPTSELPEPKPEITVPESADPCETITCEENEICKGGKCECQGKQCDDKCIPNAECCTDEDCEGLCENYKCVMPKCRVNEILENGECECAEGYVYCEPQEKCIKKNDCCYHTDCPRGDRCVDTVWRTRFCAESESKKTCRLLADNGMKEYIEIGNTALRISTNKWFTDGSVTFQINQENVTLPVNGTKIFENLKIYQEKEEILGGYCKEDDE